jgi:tripartite-type tricarboxylate transporter receptor subunit TctC
MSNSLSLSRRRSLQTLAATALFALGTAPAMAQTPYPSKPITMIVPFSAGGTTDILARVVGQALSTELGQSIIIDNRPGAGGNIGGQAAARAAGDGYTLFMGTVGTHAINEALYRRCPSTRSRTRSLTRVANVPNLLVAHPSQPFKTVKEMMAYAKANPGKLISAPRARAAPSICRASCSSP